MEHAPLRGRRVHIFDEVREGHLDFLTGLQRLLEVLVRVLGHPTPLFCAIGHGFTTFEGRTLVMSLQGITARAAKKGLQGVQFRHFAMVPDCLPAFEPRHSRHLNSRMASRPQSASVAARSAPFPLLSHVSGSGRGTPLLAVLHIIDPWFWLNRAADALSSASSDTLPDPRHIALRRHHCPFLLETWPKKGLVGNFQRIWGRQSPLHTPLHEVSYLCFSWS